MRTVLVAPFQGLFFTFFLAVASASAAEERIDRSRAGATVDPKTWRLVGSAPGVEIRADERNFRHRVLVPLDATDGRTSPSRPFDVATAGSMAPPAGAGWRPFPLYGGNVTAIAVSPVDPGYVLAGIEEGEGGASGNLYESRDGGVTWSRVTSPLSPIRFRSYVRDIEFTPDGTAYVASESRLHRRAPDTGEWTTVMERLGRYFHEVSLHPADPEEIWTGGYDGFGGFKLEVLRSRDGGATWTNVAPPIATEMFTTGLAFSTRDPRVVVASFGYNTGELWRSADGGETWSRQATLTNSVYSDVVYDGTYFWASAERWTQGGVFISSNEGLSWSRVNNGSWPSNQVFDLAVDPSRPGVILAATGRGVFRCQDLFWTYRVGGTDRPSHAVGMFPGDATRILAGQESEGMVRSVDGGASFEVVSEGLLGLYLQSVAQNPVNPQELTVTFQAFNTGGILTSLDGGQTWEQDRRVTAVMGDVEYGPDGTLYVVSWGPAGDAGISPEGLHRRNPNGSWTYLGPGTSPGSFDHEISCVRIHPNSPETILVVAGHWPDNSLGIWRSTNRGDRWTRVLARAITGTSVWFAGGIEFVGGGSEVLAVLPNGGAYRSDDAGVSWSPIADLAVVRNGSFLRGTPADPGTFYLIPYSRPAGYVTRDGGHTWSSFSSGGLIRFGTDISDPDILYGQRSVTGEYVRSIDGGRSFAAFGEGLPATTAFDFAWATGTCPTLLLAASSGLYGRTIDTAAPQISLELEPSVLWPPDHKLRTITARVTTIDACDASPSFALSSVTVEDETGSAEDVVAEIGPGTTTFQLRAERPGKGARRYLVAYTATDASGNTSEATATVLVPHDRSDAPVLAPDAPSAVATARTEMVSIDPNPFNPSTSVTITLAGAERVTLDVYDVRGARVRALVSGRMPAGTHRIAWDGIDGAGQPSASGVYFFRFTAGSTTQTMKALLVK